jgi:hypothetical protein
MFVPDKTVNEVAEDLLPLFEVGDFNTRTPTKAMIPAALEALSERRLPARRSLAGLVAKEAKAAWIEIVMGTKRELMG